MENGSKPWTLSEDQFLEGFPRFNKNFYDFMTNVLKTDATRRGYYARFKQFLVWCDGRAIGTDGSVLPNPCKCDDIVGIKDPHTIEDLLRGFLGYLKNDRKSTGATQRQYITAIMQFLSESRVKIDGKYVTRVISKHTQLKIESWTKEEIRKMLKTTMGSKPKYKAIILTYASSGIRREGLTDLKYGDLKEVEDFYEITVYSGEPEEYTTFCTPEARKAIDSYLDERRSGREYTSNVPIGDGSRRVKRVKKVAKPENITQDSYVFTTEHKSEDKIGSQMLTASFLQIQKSAGLDGQKKKHSIHSFRHGFQTALTNAKVIGKDGMEYPAIPQVRQRQLMGHKVGTNDLQYLYTDSNKETLVNEYKKVMHDLTICLEDIQKKEIEDLREKVAQPEIQTTKEFEEFKTQMYAEKKEMLEQIANLTKAVRDLSQIQKYEEAVENSLVRTRKGSKKVVVSPDRAYLID